MKYIWNLELEMIEKSHEHFYVGTLLEYISTGFNGEQKSIF